MNAFWGSVAMAIILIIIAGVVLAVNCALAIYEFLEGDWYQDDKEGGYYE